MMKSGTAILYIIAITVASMASGCTRTTYIPVETAVRDSTSSVFSLSEYQLRMLMTSLRESVDIRDSVFVRDSTVTVVNEAGDIVSRERYRDTGREHRQTETAELLQQRYDSIINAQREELNAVLEKLKETPVPVERKLTKWEKLKQDAGTMTLGASIIIVAFLIIWIVRRFRQKN